jgi:hypothetical protein
VPQTSAEAPGTPRVVISRGTAVAGLTILALAVTAWLVLLRLREQPQSGWQTRGVSGRHVGVEPRWSPDGGQIAYHNRQDRWFEWDLAVLELDTGRRYPVVARHSGLYPRAWDGARHLVGLGIITYVKPGRPGPRRIWSVDVVTGDLRWIGGLPGGVIACAVDPSADRAAYAIQGVLRVTALDGQRVLRQMALPEGVTLGWLDLSPDGRKVVAGLTHDSRVKEQSAEGLWVFDLESGGSNQLTHGPDYEPRWAPDGERVAFVRNRGSPPPALCVLEADGRVQVVARGVDDFGLSWAPDGERIAYATRSSQLRVAGPQLPRSRLGAERR